jgi:hypothetical protein
VFSSLPAFTQENKMDSIKRCLFLPRNVKITARRYLDIVAAKKTIATLELL